MTEGTSTVLSIDDDADLAETLWYGRVLSRNQLINAVLSTSVAITDQTVDVHVTAIRKKLVHAAPWLQTIRGVGYTFREPQ